MSIFGIFGKKPVAAKSPDFERLTPGTDAPVTSGGMADVFIPDFRGVKAKAPLYPLASRSSFDPDRGGSLSPKLVVWHHTVSYNVPGTESWFKSSGADIHLLVGHKGEVVQMVEFNRVAHHAGASSWMGLTSLNNHAIGIEFINIGPLKKGADGKMFDYYGREWKGEVRRRKTQGFEYWEPLTSAQEQRFLEIGLFLYVAWGLEPKHHIAHYECSPGRKNDPAGAFSWGLMDKAREQLEAYIAEAKRRGLA